MKPRTQLWAGPGLPAQHLSRAAPLLGEIESAQILGRGPRRSQEDHRPLMEGAHQLQKLGISYMKGWRKAAPF